MSLLSLIDTKPRVENELREEPFILQFMMLHKNLLFILYDAHTGVTIKAQICRMNSPCAHSLPHKKKKKTVGPQTEVLAQRIVFTF